MTTTERFPMLVPADLVAGPEQGHWTYADYAALPDDGQRYEVMDSDAYAQAGVQEYWRVHPDMQTVEPLVLQNGAYSSLGVLRGKTGVLSQVVPGIASISVEQFFV
jgi:Uma2 family endonuclease